MIQVVNRNASIFNLFFEAELFAVILTLHVGTHGHSQEFLLWGLMRPREPKFEAESGLGVLAASPEAISWESGGSLPHGGVRAEPRLQMHFGRTNSPHNKWLQF